jgi:hypothetical protein
MLLFNAGRFGNTLKGHFSRGTTVPVFTVFMDPSPIVDPVICGGGEGFHEDNRHFPFELCLLFLYVVNYEIS